MMINRDTEDKRESRKEEKEEKEPRNTATLYICTVPRAMTDSHVFVLL